MCEVTSSTSDGHHTFGELYAYRAAYNAGMANEIEKAHPGTVVKSRYHHDGEPCFGGGYFIVVMSLWCGQVSNHYELNTKNWKMFNVPEVDLPPVYDGHTPAQALERLEIYALNTLPTSLTG